MNAPERPGESEAEARARARALLEATHTFPCAYSVTVIAFNQETVTAAVREAAYLGSGDVEAASEATYLSQESSAGKYRSHRLAVPVIDAEAVLALYARLRSVDGVVTLL